MARSGQCSKFRSSTAARVGRHARIDGASPDQTGCPYGRRMPRQAHRRADSP
jgi:hypothetical protein